MLNRYLGALPVAATVLALATVPVASHADAGNASTGQSIGQQRGGQTVTQPGNQNVTQTTDAQTVTQGAQSVVQPGNGSQTVAQPGQCISQTKSGQVAIQGGQNVSQGTDTGPCPPSTRTYSGGTTTGAPAPTHSGGTTTGAPAPPRSEAGASTGGGNTGSGVPAGPPGPPVPRVEHAVVASTKTLAFTGLEVWKLILTGGLLIAASAGIWRAIGRARRDSTDRESTA